LRQLLTRVFGSRNERLVRGYARAVRAANQLAGRTLYRWWHAAPGDAPAIASNGAAVLPDFAFGSDAGATDLVLVFCTPQSVRGLMQGKLTIGADASGPFRGGIEQPELHGRALTAREIAARAHRALRVGAATAHHQEVVG